jgi:signal transduction histidine kinase
MAPLGVLGGLGLRTLGEAGDLAIARSRAALDTKAADALELRTVETARAIADFLQEREADLETVALYPPTPETYLAFYQARQRALWFLENGQEVHRAVPLYREMAYIDATGQEVVKVLDGRVVDPSELRNVSDPRNTLFLSETYFLEARKLAPGQVYVSHVTGFYVDEASFTAGKRFGGVVRFAKPLFDSRGRLTGMVVLALDSRHVEEFTAHILPTAEGFAAVVDPATGNYAYIVDDQGYAIAHPQGYVMRGLGPNGESLPYATTKEQIGTLPTRVDQLGFVDENLASIPGRAARGEAGSIQYFWSGHDKFVAYAPIPYYGGSYAPPAGFGWVGIGADVQTFHQAATLVGDAVQAGVQGLVTMTLVVLGATGLVVLVTAGVLAYQIAKPVQQLTVGVRAMEQGDFATAQRAARDVRTRDELGTLAKGFDQMAIQLQETLTGLQQQEEALQRANVELEQRVAERTAALQATNESLQREIVERQRVEEQLRHYAARLEQSSEEIKQFAYIVSHDLRAPLINLRGFSTELRSAAAALAAVMPQALPHLDQEQRQAALAALEADMPEALGFIDAAVTRMDSFINAVLKLSRLGHRELKPEPIDMNALVQGVLQTLAHQIEERQVRVTVHPLPEVVADRVSMEQIMGNILTNAVIYLDPDRPGLVEVTGEQGAGETIFRIRDNGRGIAAEDMPKVFALFRRAGRQDVPGEGMGLAYIQALVRRHGGNAWCESRLGEGTTFFFTIAKNQAGSEQSPD